MIKARGQCGTEAVCKTVETGSIPARASTKYASLAEMHWWWRYIYWPAKQALYRNVEYPLIVKTNDFMKPIREAQARQVKAERESEIWKQKYIEVSKENAKLKRMK